MTVKSTTQMTKAELISLLRDKDKIIADLNSRIDDLEGLLKRMLSRVRKGHNAPTPEFERTDPV